MLSYSYRITKCLTRNSKYSVTTVVTNVLNRRITRLYCIIAVISMKICIGVESKVAGCASKRWMRDDVMKLYIRNKLKQQTVSEKNCLKKGFKLNPNGFRNCFSLVLQMMIIDRNFVMVKKVMFIFDPGGGRTSVCMVKFLPDTFPINGGLCGGGDDFKEDQDFFRLSGIHWNSDLVKRLILYVVFLPELRNSQASIRDALLESNVAPYNGFNLDHVIGSKIGGSTFDGFGRRHTAADGHIRIALHTCVERILFNTLDSTSPLTPPSSGFASKRKPVAVGVSYRDRMGKSHHAMVRGRGEVILCAGAIGSPQLLLLRSYLYDNPGTAIVPPVPMEHSLTQVVGITDAGTSPPRSVFLHAPGSSSLYLTVATIMEKIVGPLSYGSLRLASRDVRVSPLIRFNYFSNAEDLGRCVHGMRKIGELLRGRSLEEFKFQEWFGGRDFRFVGTTLPFNQSDDQLMEDFCRRTVSTIWHYHVRCIVRKVVESDHSVIGVDSLMIVNNPQATVVMMMGTGRYVGRKDSGRKKTSLHRR